MAKKKDTIVVLIVDVQNISSTTIKQNIVFTDTRNDIETAGDSEDFETKVDIGKGITWCAIVKPSDNSANYRVGVHSVSKNEVNGGANILKNTPYTDKNGDGIVVGSINSNYTSEDENYHLSIRTCKKVNGTWTGPFEFPVDPKIKMNPDE